MKFLLLAALTFSSAATYLSAEPLASWNDGDSKNAIIKFVTASGQEGDAGFVAPADRIAVFDNDGTLWAEQPAYFQLYYALDKARRLADADPSWAATPALKAAAAADFDAVMEGGEEALLEVLLATHSGASVEVFKSDVAEWASSATHPDTGALFTDMLYQPMLELLDYLRENGFMTYIVSGGGVDFMRAFAEEAYGIPPQQVIGSSLDRSFQVIDGVPLVIKGPDLSFIDDKEGKPVAISQHIGKRPVFAAGNSDGDYQMLQWSTSGDGPRMGLIVHHTDADREWAYDRDSHIGRLNDALDDAPEAGWLVVDMASDWKTVFSAKVEN